MHNTIAMYPCNQLPCCIKIKYVCIKQSLLLALAPVNARVWQIESTEENTSNAVSIK